MSLFVEPWVPFTQAGMVPSLVEIGRVVLKKRVFIYFRYFVIISPWKMPWSFIWTNLSPLCPRMLCVKFGWNSSCGSGEDENVKILQTDGRRSEKFTWAISSGELKTKGNVLNRKFKVFDVEYGIFFRSETVFETDCFCPVCHSVILSFSLKL